MWHVISENRLHSFVIGVLGELIKGRCSFIFSILYCFLGSCRCIALFRKCTRLLGHSETRWTLCMDRQSPGQTKSTLHSVLFYRGYTDQINQFRKQQDANKAQRICLDCLSIKSTNLMLVPLIAVPSSGNSSQTLIHNLHKRRLWIEEL